MWDSATKNDKVAVGLLGTWRAVSEALKSHVEPQSQTCGLRDGEGAAGSFTDPTATSWAPLLLQPSKAFAVAPPADLNVPFDPGLLAFTRRWICFSSIWEERDTLGLKTELLDNLKRDTSLKRNGKWRLLSQGT